MIEAYRIGVTLTMTNNVGPELGRLSAQFGALHKLVKQVQGSVDGLAGSMAGLGRTGTAAAEAWANAAAAVERAARAAKSAGSGASPQSVLRLPPPSTAFTMPGGAFPTGGASFPRGTFGGALVLSGAGGGTFAGGPGSGGALASVPFNTPAGGPIPLNYAPGRSMPPLPASHDMVAAAAGFGAIGTALLGLVDGSFKARAEVEHLTSQLGRMGFSKAETDDALRRATDLQQNVAGLTIAGGLKIVEDLFTVTQNKGDALDPALLKSFAQSAVVLSATGKGDAMAELFKAMQAGELRGAFSGANGAPDVAKASAFLQSVLATTIQTGGRVGPNEIRQFISSGGMGAAMLGDRDLFADAIAPIISMGAAKAGTGLQAFAQQFAAGKMSEAGANLLLQMGLLHGVSGPDDLKQYKVGIGQFRLPPGMLEGEDMAREHPFEFMNKVLLPRIDAYNLASNGAPRDDKDRDAQRMATGAALASRIPGGNLLGDVLRNWSLVMRDRDAIAGANARGANEGAFKQFEATDPNAKTAAFSAAINGLLVALGGPLMEGALGAIKDLTGALNAISAWASAHPDATRRLMELTAGIGAMSAAMAVLSGVFVVAGPMFTVLRWLPGGVTALAGSVNALSLAAPGTVAASVGTLAGVIGVLGKAALAAYAAHAALSAVDPNDKMGSWIDRHVPGAAVVDDFFGRHGGWGRTYQQQHDADPNVRPQSFVPPPASSGGGGVQRIALQVDRRTFAEIALDSMGRVLDRPPSGQVAFDHSMSPRFGGASFA